MHFRRLLDSRLARIKRAKQAVLFRRDGAEMLAQGIERNFAPEVIAIDDGLERNRAHGGELGQGMVDEGKFHEMCRFIQTYLAIFVRDAKPLDRTMLRNAAVSAYVVRWLAVGKSVLASQPR